AGRSAGPPSRLALGGPGIAQIQVPMEVRFIDKHLCARRRIWCHRKMTISNGHEFKVVTLLHFHTLPIHFDALHVAFVMQQIQYTVSLSIDIMYGTMGL
ncbi:hypothetical protein D6833_04580, partial [Candidatus Parcubacteria bacterium]